MIDSYRTMNPEYRSYIKRARELRSQAVRAAGRYVLRWLRNGFQRLKCRLMQHRNERQLHALSNSALKDIGVSRGEISWRVRKAMPCS